MLKKSNNSSDLLTTTNNSLKDMQKPCTYFSYYLKKIRSFNRTINIREYLLRLRNRLLKH
jgi:hypothetical protein